jgi:hypothetical protein
LIVSSRLPLRSTSRLPARFSSSFSPSVLATIQPGAALYNDLRFITPLFFPQDALLCPRCCHPRPPRLVASPGGCDPAEACDGVQWPCRAMQPVLWKRHVFRLARLVCILQGSVGSCVLLIHRPKMIYTDIVYMFCSCCGSECRYPYPARFRSSHAPGSEPQERPRRRDPLLPYLLRTPSSFSTYFTSLITCYTCTAAL